MHLRQSLKKSAIRSPRQEILKIAETKSDPPPISSKAYAHYSMGMIYDNEGKTDQAIEEYLRAIEFDSQAAPAYYRLGSAYLKLGDIESAISALNKTIELNKEKCAGQIPSRPYLHLSRKIR